LAHRRRSVEIFAKLLGSLLVLQGAAPAQVQPIVAPKLRIVVLAGEDGLNDIQQGTAVTPSVRVEDESGRPIAGAVVVFTAPDTGPSAVFSDGTRSLLVHTDARGEATARGLRPSASEGPFQLRVDATYRGGRTTAMIRQTNVKPIVEEVTPVGRKPKSRKGLFIALAGGAAAAIALGMSRGGGGNGSTVPPPAAQTTITAGTVTVGPPR
jgi:hypothetical protein